MWIHLDDLDDLVCINYMLIICTEIPLFSLLLDGVCRLRFKEYLEGNKDAYDVKKICKEYPYFKQLQEKGMNKISNKLKTYVLDALQPRGLYFPPSLQSSIQYIDDDINYFHLISLHVLVILW